MSITPTFVEIHAIQTIPPSCVNRDDTGSPKSASFGGVQRARVSSQAWKKATRDYFAEHIDADLIGKRTVEVVALLSESIMGLDDGIDTDEATGMAEDVLKAIGIKLKNRQTSYLVFIAPRQVKALAQLAVDAKEAGEAVDSKAAKSILNVRQNPKLNAVDLAMFGRMVADAPDLNSDAAVQVAHAIGVDSARREFDYFTAVDDCKPDDTAGATMIGTVEFLSTTLYRYAVIDVAHLLGNLGDEDVTRIAIEEFIKAFLLSMPTGKQNSFANRTLPNAVMVTIRDTQPVNLSGAFERPVAPEAKGIPATAADRLAEHATAIDKAYETTPQHVFVVSTVDSPSLTALATDDEDTIPAVAKTVTQIVCPSDED